MEKALSVFGGAFMKQDNEFMKNWTRLFCAFACVCLSILTVQAQEKDDSKYLAGAVPEVEGKVVFSKTYSIPGMSKDEVFNRINLWMNDRLKKNENNSRVVFTDPDNGQIVGSGEEWLVFSSTALALDRTRITYQLFVECQAERCTFSVQKIRYIYREGKEKYTAEEWIVDKYALNKAKTKLTLGLAKWRRKTVDFVDELCLDVAEALSVAEVKKPATEQPQTKEPEKSVAASGTMVIAPKHVVTVETNTPAAAPAAKAETPAPQPTGAYKEVAPEQLTADAIQTGAGKLVIVIGEEPFNMTMMTANAGGSLGKVNGKPVVFTILSPEQAYEQLEKAEKYVVRFYPNGENEPKIILECRKMPAPAAMEGMPRTYVGEILKATTK